METIKIAHLYYDLMNLYGENGNVKALTRHFEANNIKVITHFLTVDDAIDFQKYDIFYIGSGSKDNFQIVREDILKYQKDIKKALKNQKYFIITGNALNLFGTTYKDLDEKEYSTLNILKYTSEEIDFRIVGETIMEKKDLPLEIIGFQNRFTVLKDVQENALFHVKSGTGYIPKSTEEGIWKNNFLGTYVLGPLLIRNPFLTEAIVKKVLEEKKIPYLGYQDPFEMKAYEEYKKNLLNEE